MNKGLSWELSLDKNNEKKVQKEAVLVFKMCQIVNLTSKESIDTWAIMKLNGWNVLWNIGWNVEKCIYILKLLDLLNM